VRVVAAPGISGVHIYKALTISQMFIDDPNVMFETTDIMCVAAKDEWLIIEDTDNKFGLVSLHALIAKH